MASSKRLTVYEIINEQRQEIYVGSTALPIFALIGEIAKARPAAIKHWELKDATSVRSVEFDLSPEAAQSFVAKYVKTKLPRGWRYVTEG